MQGDLFKALSDATRRDILRLLRDGDLTAGTIADNFSISKPSISHHLAALRNAGLVTTERRGQEIVYSLNATVFQELMAYSLEFLDSNDEGGPEE
ncbi:MAG: autorepressor SdpR family transcription factor [Coriobacteriia bacterium]|nr:autorepressor SdpR family transcription factor [Coriobacteriia bacterium]